MYKRQVKGRVIDDDELKETYANKQPYGEWLDRNLLKLEDLKIPNERVPEYTKEERQRMQKAFGYTYESLREAILPMAKNGDEGTSAMGIDTPLAALASDHQPLFNYFKQLFAQVTNPPIDSIREKVVTSTTVYIGEDGNLRFHLQGGARDTGDRHEPSARQVQLRRRRRGCRPSCEQEQPGQPLLCDQAGGERTFRCDQ